MIPPLPEYIYLSTLYSVYQKSPDPSRTAACFSGKRTNRACAAAKSDKRVAFLRKTAYNKENQEKDLIKELKSEGIKEYTNLINFIKNTKSIEIDDFVLKIIELTDIQK